MIRSAGFQVLNVLHGKHYTPAVYRSCVRKSELCEAFLSRQHSGTNQYKNGNTENNASRFVTAQLMERTSRNSMGSFSGF